MISLTDLLSSNSKASMKVGPNTALSANKMFSVKAPEVLTTSEKNRVFIIGNSIRSKMILTFMFSYQ